jgi:hypothetical protein
MLYSFTPPPRASRTGGLHPMSNYQGCANGWGVVNAKVGVFCYLVFDLFRPKRLLSTYIQFKPYSSTHSSTANIFPFQSPTSPTIPYHHCRVTPVNRDLRQSCFNHGPQDAAPIASTLRALFHSDVSIFRRRSAHKRAKSRLGRYETNCSLLWT